MIEERKTVKLILDHLGTPKAAPRVQPARGPLAWQQEHTIWA